MDMIDVIMCDGKCGRSLVSIDGPGMIAAIKGPCPTCGGRFVLLRDPRRGDGKGLSASGLARELGVQPDALDA